MIMPTNKVEVGDVILVKDSLRCVVEVKENTIMTMNYKTATIEELVPECHILLGNTYFYGKVVNLFSCFGNSSNGGSNQLTQFMMMSQLLGNTGDYGCGCCGNSMNNLMPLLLMNNMNSGQSDNIFTNMFSGLFGGSQQSSKTE